MKTRHKPITNRAELRQEIRRLRLEVKEQEKGLRNEVRNIRNQFQPHNLLMNALSAATGIRIDKHEFLRHGIAAGLSMVLQRFVFKSETTIEKKIYGWIDDIFNRLRYYMGKAAPAGPTRSGKIEEEEGME
jgi:hypothetical protein